MVYYEQPDGESPAQDYVEGMLDSEQYDMLQIISRVGTQGHRYDNPRKFKQLHGDENLYELISYQHRVFAFIGVLGPTGKPQLVMTNGYKKKAKRTEPQQMERAKRLREEYFARRSEQ